MAKMLIAYFSKDGENYVEGKMKNLEKGNTAAIAEYIQKITGADLYEIKREIPYPYSYKECVEQAKQEFTTKARPALLGELPEINNYDTVILGYPNWCGTAPMVVFSFLEKLCLAGKTIAPFCSNAGSGLGTSELDLEKAAPQASFRQGLSIHGGISEQSESVIREWLKQNEF